MLVRQQALPAYNIQTAVDTEHALIVTHAVVLDASDIHCRRPMAEAAKNPLGVDSFQLWLTPATPMENRSPTVRRRS
jgi:hypothetical protein